MITRGIIKESLVYIHFMINPVVTCGTIASSLLEQAKDRRTKILFSCDALLGTTSRGKLKPKKLKVSNFAKALLRIPHGNANVEEGFCENLPTSA